MLTHGSSVQYSKRFQSAIGRSQIGSIRGSLLAEIKLRPRGRFLDVEIYFMRIAPSKNP